MNGCSIDKVERPQELTDPGTPTPAQSGRRAAVLQFLRESDEPQGAAEVALTVGVHLNTARFHLDALVTEGQVVRGTAPRTEPGRPKVVYSPAPGAGARDGSRSFRFLADILTGIVSSSVPDPVGTATEAGRAWGNYLTDTPAPNERISAEEAQRRLVANLESMGFVPETKEEGAERRINLHHCPFREVAQRQPDIVCAIHLGLMQGTVATLKAPLKAERLEPFVTPHLCVATLRRTDTGGAGDSGATEAGDSGVTAAGTGA